MRLLFVLLPLAMSGCNYSSGHGGGGDSAQNISSCVVTKTKAAKLAGTYKDTIAFAAKLATWQMAIQKSDNCIFEEGYEIELDKMLNSNCEANGPCVVIEKEG